MILLKRKNVNTKKGYNLTFLRNVRTILLRFGGKKSSLYCNNANFSQFYESAYFYKILKLPLNFES